MRRTVSSRHVTRPRARALLRVVLSPTLMAIFHKQRATRVQQRRGAQTASALLVQWSRLPAIRTALGAMAAREEIGE